MDLHVRVITGDLRLLDETQAVKALGAVEHRAHHRVQREVGLDLRLVELEALLAHLLGVPAPVPGLDAQVVAELLAHLVEHRPLARGGRLGRLPDLVQQRLHRRLAAGHGVGQRVVGEAAMAVQRGLLVPQREQLPHQRAVVGLAGRVAAADPGAPGLLAQVAPLAEGQEGHDQRARQRHHVHALLHLPAVQRRLARGGADEVRQAGQVAFAAQHQLVAALVGQHVLREAGVEFRLPLHVGGVALAVRALQPGAGADEVQVHALQQPAHLALA